MPLPTADILRRLGAGASIESLCRDAGMSRDQFDAWWQQQLASRLPQTDGELPAGAPGRVEILRDRWGVPHVFGDTDPALFFGFGFAMAQDRLWQMDYLRRRAHGRLAEILGPSALGLDVISRTVGITRIANQHVHALPPETATLLGHFSAGVNASIKQRPALPIEFGLMDYSPEPWTPLDSIAILGEFRWYLTGRLFVIAFPEIAKRTLADDALYSAFLTPEAGLESIVPAESYAKQTRRGNGVRREAIAGGAGGAGGAGVGDEGGSNNWAVAGSRSTTGKPLVSSDPHIAFGSTSCWHEIRLTGGSFDCAGMSYVGVPAIMIGRNPRVAWGITNNICSQRDLYQERTDPSHPGAFLYDGRWEPAREVVEKIQVRDGAPVSLSVRFSRNGPIVDELLPEPTRGTGPVSLRWMGAESCDEITSSLAATRARTAAEFREALRGWSCPTWSFVFADVDGHIGYQGVGRIPIRDNWDRGYRPGWDPAHQWHESIPYDEMPSDSDPDSGWVRSANNRPAPHEFPYPLSNTSGSGHRAQRIRQLLEAQERFSPEDFARMQMDTLSLRAVEAKPGLVRLLANASDERVRRAVEILGNWNCRMDREEAGAAIFEPFFIKWSQAVIAERFPTAAVPHLAGAIGGLALELLSEDRFGWFTRSDRAAAASDALRDTVIELEARLGADVSRWSWGRVHTLALRHALSGRGDLGVLLDRGGPPVRGSGVTVCNTGYDPNYMASIGANYRFIADLSSKPPALRAVDAAGASGEPGSPHYCDQSALWLEGEHKYLTLDRAQTEREATTRLILHANGTQDRSRN
jgi:penicillin amidase